MLTFYLAAASTPWAVGTAAGRGSGPDPADPDALYANRATLSDAREAADIWTRRAAAGADYEAAWKAARADYWIGTQGDEKERRPALERGTQIGAQAASLQPGRPEGHFWAAANMGALAQSFGLLQGIKYRGRIKDELQRVLAIDEAWEQGSADRALGRWYSVVPGLFGGSQEKAEQYLRKALAYNPQSTATLMFLSDVLEKRGKKAEARAMLQRVMDAPIDPEWGPEDRQFKAEAATRLMAAAAGH